MSLVVPRARFAPGASAELAFFVTSKNVIGPAAEASEDLPANGVPGAGSRESMADLVWHSFRIATCMLERASAARAKAGRGTRGRKLRRIGLIALPSLLVVCLALWIAVHQLPGFGPWLADSLRFVVGSKTVTRTEELQADVEDRVKRLLPSAPPRSLEQAQPVLAPKVRPPAPTKTLGPRGVGAMNARVAAKSDGVWRAVTDPARPHEEPVLFATLLHPDAKRPWAEVFVVAADLAKLRLYAVAGTIEPESTTPAGVAYVRSGVIPLERRASLVAAFNGGFMTKHGHHGMRVDGVTLVPSQPRLCTILGLPDDVKIASWKALEADVSRAEREGLAMFWRQAAPCMYERGALNPRLRDENIRNWGATIDGKVVIRRSAIGLSAVRDTLFVAVSNDTTATAIAQAMHHAGATDVAQLDVNWSYPRFVMFPAQSDGRRRAQGLFPGFVFREDDYVERPSTRDFFYLVRRD